MARGQKSGVATIIAGLTLIAAVLTLAAQIKSALHDLAR